MTEPQNGNAENAVLTPAEVAAMFRVHVKTVSRWTDAGRLPYFTTPGGNRRFYRADIEKAIGRTPAEAGQ